MPPTESHDEFRALCALATSGSLSAEERDRLCKHLAECPSCRDAVAQYEAVIGHAIPTFAPELPLEKKEDPSWSLEEAEASLFARLEAEENAALDNAFGSHSETIPDLPMDSLNASRPPDDGLWRHMWWQYAAGLLLIAALASVVYRVGIQRGTEFTLRTLPVTPLNSSAPPQTASEPRQGSPTTTTSTQRDKDLVDTLRAQVERKSVEISRLKADQAQMESAVSGKTAEADRLIRERTDLTQELSATKAGLQAAQEKLDAASNQGVQNAAQVASLEAKVAQLNDVLHSRDEEVVREQELLDHDRDIRELMGARDLYIAEVYDVAKTGDTEKPFGRVFYTKGKSLVFYAYDLDDRPGVESASIFQAWGRRGPDRDRAVKLGILYQDNANKKRWVLKSHDPRTLEQIDAIFVTVEPNGGSQHPSGKPFLFAYLRNDPNHP